MRLSRDQSACPATWPSPEPPASLEKPPPRRGASKKSNLKEIWPLVVLWAFVALFIVVYSVYIYKTLLSPDPAFGSLLPSASDTNLVVSVLSQVLANLVDMLLTGVFDVLRWQLAARFAGISATTFFQLSSSTPWLPVLFLTITRLSSSGVGLFRLMLPLFGLYFGSILKYKAEFVYHFKESGGSMPVFAGSGVPMDELVLGLIPASTIGIYFVSWIPTLLDVPKFAVSMPVAGCGGNCTSSFLPGGIETTRKLSPYLNMTLMEGGVFRDSETIQIRNAPGILLRFDSLPPGFDFDRTHECHTYGQHLNDTLQVCIRPINGSLAVGWAACPTPLYRTSTCTTNTTWLSAPLPKSVLMTRYKQYATTAYSGLDFSILNADPTSPPIPEPLNASTYLATWAKILQLPPPTPGGSGKDDGGTDPNTAMPSALVYAITWLLRLYDDVFPDDAHTPRAHLRNFLAIPQQFMVTCLQFANYTVAAAGAAASDDWRGKFALPADMQTVAIGGVSTTRLLAVGWVVWVYIASAGAVVLGAGVTVLGMVVTKERVPGSTGFVEVDLAARFQSRGAHTFQLHRAEEDGDGLAVMRELGRAREVRRALNSSFGVARELRRRKIRVVAVSEDGGEGESAGGGPAGDELFAFREGGANMGKGLDSMDSQGTTVANFTANKPSWQE